MTKDRAGNVWTRRARAREELGFGLMVASGVAIFTALRRVRRLEAFRQG